MTTSQLRDCFSVPFLRSGTFHDDGLYRRWRNPGVVLLVSVILLVSAAVVHAQQPDVRPYRSEEDLWEALREGEITYDEFLELIDVHRLGTDRVTIPAEDWEQLPGADGGYLTAPDSADVLATVDSAAPVAVPVRWSVRSGYDTPLDPAADGEGYTVARFQRDHWRGLLDWEHDGERGAWRRRTLVWKGHGLTTQLADVEPRWGRGLVIGRRARVIGSSNLKGSFWQPRRSRFNGAWATTDEGRPVSGGVVLSDIRSETLTDRVVGVLVTAGRSTWRFGISALSGAIERRDSAGIFTQQIIGGHAHIGPTGREILAEIAVGRGGSTAKAIEALWRLEHGQVHATAWSYSEQFVNPWGGGPSHNDTRDILLEGINEEYSARTTGERGFYLSTRFQPSAPLAWRWEWMAHREAPGEAAQYAWTARMAWHVRGWTLTPFTRGSSTTADADTYSFGSYVDWANEARRLHARWEFGRHRATADRFLRAGVDLRWDLNAHVYVAPAIRWVDPDLDHPADGYWYIYLTETILPFSGGRFDAALAWQRYEDRTKGDRIELRLRTAAFVGGRSTPAL